MIEQPICAHGFNSTICVAPAGHAGAHVTSNERFPHGLAIITSLELRGPALPAPPDAITNALLGLQDLGRFTRTGIDALITDLRAALPTEHAPPRCKNCGSDELVCAPCNQIVTGAAAEEIRREIQEGTPDTPERIAMMQRADELFNQHAGARAAKLSAMPPADSGSRPALAGSPEQKISEPTNDELIALGECAVHGYIDFPAAKSWFSNWLAGRAETSRGTNG